MENILNILCDPDDPRKHVKYPWFDDTHSYSTDGACLFRVIGKYYGIPWDTHRPNTDIFNFDAMTGPGIPIDIDKFNKFKEGAERCHDCHNGPSTYQCCEECDGEGYLILDSKYNEYKAECKSCDGDGYSGKHNTDSCPECEGTGFSFGNSTKFKIGDKNFSLVYIALLHKNLKNLKFYPDADVHRDAIGFRFDGGDGVLMSKRD